MLKKVKKVKTSVDFIQTANLTELENLVVMLHSGHAGKNDTKKREQSFKKYSQATSLQN